MTGIRVTGRSSWLGAGLGLGVLSITVAVLVPFRSDVSRASPGLLMVVAVVVAGIVGGARPAVFAAVVGAALFNLVFIPPFWTFKVDAAEDWVALGVFLAVGLAVGLLVANETERRRAAEQREALLLPPSGRWPATSATEPFTTRRRAPSFSRPCATRLSASTASSPTSSR